MSTIASTLLERHWDGNLPIKPEAIAQAMGLKVAAQFGQEGGYSGCIEKQPNGDVVIAYDLTEPRVRQRFTIAHEIGHFALGHLTENRIRFRDTVSNFSTGAYAPEETAANRFAADLLMPAHVLRYVVVERGVDDVERLANAFDVSQVAMRYRLQNLGLI